MHKMMENNHGVESSNEGGGKIVSDYSPFDYFPEDCISKIVSFTSPRDACVAATVSKTFESAVNSDAVWEKFLPLEYASLVPSSRNVSSKKELYFSLCDEPDLIDDGTKSFWLEKASGKECIMLSPMNMSIIWGDTRQDSEWITTPEARYKKVAQLPDVCWFEIRGRVNTRILSPRTRYSAYIVFKKADRCFGFEDSPIEAGVGVVGHQASIRFICFDTDGEPEMGWIYRVEREDGWMEVELGEFFNGEGDEIEMSALDTLERGWKSGLVIGGIEIRPAKIQ